MSEAESQENQDTLLEFPCDFPIKIMGSRTDDFAQCMVDIVLRHAPDFIAETVEMRASSGAPPQSSNWMISTGSLPATPW